MLTHLHVPMNVHSEGLTEIVEFCKTILAV